MSRKEKPKMIATPKILNGEGLKFESASPTPISSFKILTKK